MATLSTCCGTGLKNVELTVIDFSEGNGPFPYTLLNNDYCFDYDYDADPDLFTEVLSRLALTGDCNVRNGIDGG